MPRYFFDTVDGSRFHDTDGVELADVREARLYAVKFGGECLSSEPTLLDVDDFRVEVRDASGALRAVVKVEITESAAANDVR